jgi:hypothetical protein
MKKVIPVISLIFTLLIYNYILVPRLFGDSSGVNYWRTVGAGLAAGLGTAIGYLITKWGK